MFVIYVDELAYVLSDYNVQVFADDLKIYVVINSEAYAVRLRAAVCFDSC